jgi:hypothetical protein
LPTFNFLRDCQAFAARGYSALKPPNMDRENGRRLAEVGDVKSTARFSVIEQQYE